MYISFTNRVLFMIFPDIANLNEKYESEELLLDKTQTFNNSRGATNGRTRKVQTNQRANTLAPFASWRKTYISPEEEEEEEGDDKKKRRRDTRGVVAFLEVSGTFPSLCV